MTIALTTSEKSLIAARAASCSQSEVAFARSCLFSAAQQRAYPAAPALAALLRTLAQIEPDTEQNAGLVAELKAAIDWLRPPLLALL